MEDSKPSNVVCVCNQAVATSICEECPKCGVLNPYAVYYHPLWARKIDKYNISLDKSPKTE